MKLNQVLAVEKGSKTKIYSEFTEADKKLQKQPLISGISRIYEKKADEGEDFPPESTLVQVRVKDVIKQMLPQLEHLWDITATKEFANCGATASVKLEDGTEIIQNVPVTYLLFMEKQLNDVRKFIEDMPVLDPAREWDYDDDSEQYRSDTIKTHKTKKIQKPIVKYHATPEHPAQTEMITEDEVVGYWSTTQLSGAIPAADTLADSLMAKHWLPNPIFGVRFLVGLLKCGIIAA